MLPVNVPAMEEALLPGIPNDITLGVIIQKLSWSDFHVLPSVSRGWKRAIHSHLVYDMRICSRSTDSFAVIVKPKHSGSSIQGNPQTWGRAIFLYSMRDESWHELPGIPGIREGIPNDCQCIALDGNLYVLGGERKWHFGGVEVYTEFGSKAVYVLDLAGQRQWRQCANMQERRGRFASAVMNRKIYVFGGTDLFKPNCGSEMYDPEADAWSWMKPMPTLRYLHQATTVGEEICLHGGNFCVNSSGLDKNRQRSAVDDIDWALFLEVYHPATDECSRLIEEFEWNRPMGALFSAEVKFLVITTQGIYSFEVEKLSWTLLRAHSFPAMFISACECLADGGELLLLTSLDKDYTESNKFLLRSRGLCKDNTEIKWEKIACP